MSEPTTTTVPHHSDCAVHNAPALAPGQCNCGQRDREIWRLRKSGLTYRAIAAAIGSIGASRVRHICNRQKALQA